MWAHDTGAFIFNVLSCHIENIRIMKYQCDICLCFSVTSVCFSVTSVCVSV